MNKSFYPSYIFYGLYFGMAISSRFLLTFFYADNLLMNILSWALLFLMLSVLTMWVRKYREDYTPDNKLTFGAVNKVTFVIFLTASMFSSIVKYAVFVYVSPVKFKLFSSLALQFYNEMAQDTSLQVSLAWQQLQWAFSEWGIALIQGFSNMIWGFFAALFLWSMFKKEQLHRPASPPSSEDEKYNYDK